MNGTSSLQPGFRIVEHTADFAIQGRGRNLDELFEVMARGFFALIGDLDAVRPVQQRRVRLQVEPAADLLHDWLQELNGLHHLHGEVYSEFRVRVVGGRLQAIVRGETVDRRRHDLRHEVKGVTWHQLCLETIPGGYQAHVLLDV